jgi:tetratricopeptide (TPR) repeat protein
MSVRIFLSSVSDEFRNYRDQLRHDLTRHNVEVKVQGDFVDLGADTLAKLDTYIRHCDAVVHLIGDMTGSVPGTPEQEALAAKYPDMSTALPPLGEALAAGAYVSYTQWEAWLALYHGKLLLTAEAEPTAPRHSKYAPTDDSRRAQSDHLGRLQSVRRYPGSKFKSAADLATHIAYTAILDLLVKDYAEGEAKAREVAEGFIREMAGRVAKDRALDLDLDGMKEAVRNAIELYESEIAGQPTTTNVDAIVDRALAKAREQVDSGKSGLAFATLERAAEEMRREETERRERYEQGVRLLYTRARDIALAAYDAPRAAAAILEMAKAIRSEHDARLTFLDEEAETLHIYGRDKGSNIHLLAEIDLRQLILRDRPRDRVPLDWAITQIELGISRWTLGARESESTQLNAAVAAFRLALEECTRDRAPFQWAAAQSNLGTTLLTLSERESDISRVERTKEAIAALRLSLEEFARDSEPQQWAATMNSLGNALAKLGEDEGSTARLEEALNVFRLCLEERNRELIPLDWAATQNNIGNALLMIGNREQSPTHLHDAISAFRLSIEERSRERVPLDWAMTQTNLGNALFAIGKLETGTARLEEANTAYRLALAERSLDRAPLDWAATQDKLGGLLTVLGERLSRRDMLAEAMSAIRASWRLCQDAGYLDDDSYFAERLAAIDAALAALD